MNFNDFIKAEFPLTHDIIYYESARITPPSKSVHDAIRAFYDDLFNNGEDRDKYDMKAQEVRTKFARLINADPGETAIIRNTTEGINIASNGLAINEGDNVVTTSMEHRNNIYPWLYLRTKGVEVRVVDHENYSLPLEKVVSQIDERTRAVGISHVQFLNGYRSDLKALANESHKAGAVLVVDAIQSVGKIPIDVKEIGVDILSCGGHKGLFAGRGIGCLYCSRQVMDKIRLVVVAPDPEYRHDMQDLPNLQFPSSAKRFEAGSLNYAGIHGLSAGLDFVMGIGVEKIHEHITEIADYMQDNLESLGFDLITPRDRSQRGGIVTFSTGNPDYMVAYLKNKKILANVRNGFVRVAPHIYNTMGEAHKFIEACKGYPDRKKSCIQ